MLYVVKLLLEILPLPISNEFWRFVAVILVFVPNTFITLPYEFRLQFFLVAQAILSTSSAFYLVHLLIFFLFGAFAYIVM